MFDLIFVSSQANPAELTGRMGRRHQAPDVGSMGFPAASRADSEAGHALEGHGLLPIGGPYAVVCGITAVSTLLPTGLSVLAVCSAEITAALNTVSVWAGTRRPTQVSWGDLNMVVTTQLLVLASLSHSL